MAPTDGTWRSTTPPKNVGAIVPSGNVEISFRLSHEVISEKDLVVISVPRGIEATLVA